MGGFEELEPAPLLERNLAVAQLDLEIGRHVAGAEEHRHLPERSPLLVQFENTLHHKARLLRLILDRDEPGGFAPFAFGPEVLGESLVGARNERIGGVENRLRGAIVLLKRDDRRAWELARKVEDVAEGGAAE